MFVDGNIHLDQREVQKLRLADPANVKNVVPHTRIRMNDNVTLGKARIAAGDMGCSPWERSIPKSMDVSRNWFGNDLRMLAGDVGSGAAPGFNSMFWK